MNDLAHQMDLHAEALRNKYAERRLKANGANLEKIDEKVWACCVFGLVCVVLCVMFLKRVATGQGHEG